ELPVFVNAGAYNMFDLDMICKLFNEYINVSRVTGYDYRESELYGLNLSNENYILYNLNDDLAISLKHLSKIIELQKHLNKTEEFAIDSLEEAYKKINYVDKLARIKSFSPGYLNKKLRMKIIDMIEKYLSLSKDLKCEYLEMYDKSILNQNIDKLLADTKAAINASGKGLFKTNKALKEMTDVLLGFRHAKAKPEVMVEELQALALFKRNLLAANELSSTLTKILGDLKSLNLRQMILDLKSLDTIPDMTISKELIEEIKKSYLDLGISSLSIKQESIALMNIYKTLFEGKRINIFKETLEEVNARIVGIDKEKDNFTFYSQMMRCVNEIKKYDGADFLHAYLDKNAEIMLISTVYKRTFVKEKIDDYVNNSTALSSFKSLDAEESIGDFRELDEKILNINRDYIISTISQKRPNETVLEGSEFKILTKEYNKLRRQLPIRTLLEQTFELILDIKPVFLMSPLSVSTYLASELEMFDCVIFDEASQIFASDALGSIYRAKQCIIIGDTKQMPPT
ncbi:MAG: hypothetical protein IJA65_02345, partial [Acholeplasmatales bacterium]|nr:hypothetical protein [Acholeplasmatales bacterium]